MRQLRMAVENIRYTLDATELRRAGALFESCVGIIRWPDGMVVEFQIHLTNRGRTARCRFTYWLTSGQRCDRPFEMRTIQTDYRRWMFDCRCGRLASRIYFVHGELVCQRCGNLTYQSRRRSHALSTAKRRLALCGFDARCLGERDLILLSGFDRSDKPERLRPTIELLPVSD